MLYPLDEDQNQSLKNFICGREMMSMHEHSQLMVINIIYMESKLRDLNSGILEVRLCTLAIILTNLLYSKKYVSRG